MKILDVFYFAGTILGIIVAFAWYSNVYGQNVTSPVKEARIEYYVPIDMNNEDVIHKVNSTKHLIDSLRAANDSLTGELQVAKYKLERIRYYNDVAKKGNNITFLRGWINRVLDE